MSALSQQAQHSGIMTGGDFAMISGSIQNRVENLGEIYTALSETLKNLLSCLDQSKFSSNSERKQM
jgi:hypothetical protein